jgi:membrane dipeptidase
MTTRREFLRGTGVALAGVPFINLGRFPLWQGGAEYSARTLDLMKRATVIDMLSPLTLNFPLQDKWFADPELFTAADAKRFIDSGIHVFHIAVGMGGPDAYNQTLMFVHRWNGLIAGNDHLMMRIDSPADFERVKSAGKVGILIGIQNSDHFQRPDHVDVFWNLGQRVSQLTYNSRNWIGNGSTERRDDGLSDYGVAIVQRMNRVGMAVDVSHSGDRTTLDAFEATTVPALITHSNCRALAPGHPRCKTDEAIKAMAAKGGVMGITGVRMFVKVDEPTTVEHVLDHFDHVRKLVGPQHLGVGSDIDLDGYDDMPPEQNKRLRAGYKGSYGFRDKIDVEGLDHPKRMFDLTEGLIRRKYSDEEILGVLGGNFKRVLSQIWTSRQPPAPAQAPARNG